jgi:branched-chain amino acid transport system permease protein
MRELVLFALLGLGSGSLIAANALALVLVHRGTGAINLAAGAISAIAAFLFYGLRTGGYLISPLPFGPSHFGLGPAWATLPALGGTLVICIGIGLALNAVYRRLRGAAALAKLVASLGVLLTLLAVMQVRFGQGGQVAPSVLPTTGTVTIFGTPIPADRFVLAGIVVLVAAVLSLGYRSTWLGIATRAASEDEASATLVGLDPNRLSQVNVVLAVVIGGVLGVLVAPVTNLNAIALSESVIPALGAALLARFTSFSIACAAGLALGALQSIIIYLQTKPWFPTAGGVAWPGFSDVVTLLVIGVVLVLRGSRTPVRGSLGERRLPAAPAARHVSTTAVVTTIGCAIAVVVLPAALRQALIFTMIGSVVCMALVVITGFAGQVSLAQLALAGVAGLVLSKLSAEAGIGFPFDVILAVGASVAVGSLAAITAWRVRGGELAILTLAFAVAIENFAFNNVGWGAGINSSVSAPRLLGLNLGVDAGFPGWDGKVPSPAFGLLCVVVAVGVGVLVTCVRRSALGLTLLAVRSDERAASAMAINVRGVKLAAFALSSAIAGLAGALYGYNAGAVDPGEFGLLAGLGAVAYAYLGGVTTVMGATIGGLLAPAGIISYVATRYIGLGVNYQLFLYGLGVVGAVVATPNGAATTLSQVFRRRRPRPITISADMSKMPADPPWRLALAAATRRRPR